MQRGAAFILTAGDSGIRVNAGTQKEVRGFGHLCPAGMH